MDKETFIKKSMEKHGDKYDYSEVEYKNCDTKVCIICPKHGRFWQRPSKHYIKGQGCPKCSKKYNYTTEDWVNLVKEKYRDKYSFDKVKYINNHTKITITCLKHGDFSIRPNDFLNGEGCRQCALEKASEDNKSNTDSFIKKAVFLHNDKYDYSNVEYVDSKTKVCIICPKHGEFWQTPNCHLNGSGCPKCGAEKRGKFKRSKKEDVVENFKQKHKGKYDYSKVEYRTTEEKVCIICPKHGEFWQTPHAHLNGHGCPSCSRSLMEEFVSEKLSELGIKYETQKMFEWLKNKGNLRLDIYLSDYKTAIECQGRQHFEAVSAFGGKNGFFYIKHNDDIKKKLCEDNGVKLYYINYNDDLTEKLNEILNNVINE